MPKKLTEEEYAATLPKKQVGAAVLFFNSLGELLIVKPDYKDGWSVPGGSTDINEPPLHCAIRETSEEIGLNISDLKLAGVYYREQNGFFSDSLKFIFTGGTLTENQIAKIKLQADELEEYKFVPVEIAASLLTRSLQKSLPICLEAIKNNTVAYIE